MQSWSESKHVAEVPDESWESTGCQPQFHPTPKRTDPRWSKSSNVTSGHHESGTCLKGKHARLAVLPKPDRPGIVVTGRH